MLKKILLVFMCNISCGLMVEAFWSLLSPCLSYREDLKMSIEACFRNYELLWMRSTLVQQICSMLSRHWFLFVQAKICECISIFLVGKQCLPFQPLSCICLNLALYVFFIVCCYVQSICVLTLKWSCLILSKVHYFLHCVDDEKHIITNQHGSITFHAAWSVS